MIRFAIPALAIAATASQVQAAEVQIVSQGPVVELSVSETVDAKPDIVDISAGVTSQARTAVEAMQINAQGYNVPGPMPMRAAMAKEDASQSYRPGEQDVTASVQITFQLN